MTVLQALLLGLVQGLTEFLPVSSSGHLVIFQTLLGIQEPPILFDVLVHLATLVAVGIYFYKRFLKLTPYQIALMLIATIPAVVAGLVIEPYLEGIFTSLWIVALGLVYTSGLLLMTTKIGNQKQKLEQLSLSKGFIVGLLQAVAIMPGVSRSGSTVAAGYAVNLKKEEAFYFSFLLAVPAILGAGVLQLKDVENWNQLVTLPNLAGFIASAVSGLIALKLLDIVIKKAKLHYFAVYCLGLSLVIIMSQLI